MLWKSEPRPLSRGYKREERVERELAALLALPAAERRTRALTHYPGAEPLSSEATVFYMRECLAAGEADTAWSVAEELARRLAPRITRKLSVWKSLSPYQREEVEEALLERLYRGWLSRDPANEFWEVRFNLSLDRALSDEIDRVLRSTQHEELLSPDAESELDPWDQVPDEGAQSPLEQALIADALASLGEPLRTVFWLQCRQEWTEEEIAAHLGCTSRTVRNYLRRAREGLAAWRGQEA